jgi:hypothetical protein
MKINWNVIVPIVTVAVVGVGTTIGVLFVQGRTVDPSTGKVVQTGVLSINSQPTGAAIYINDRLQSATNQNISFLKTGTYKVELRKPGYIPWSKNISVDDEKVTKIDAILWPAIPGPAPITNTGILNPKLSPSKDKIAYAIKYSEEDKAGLWVLDTNKRAVFNNITTEFIQITRNTPNLDYSKAELIWSPNNTQILATLTDATNVVRNYLLEATKFNSNPPDITLTKDGLLDSWLKEYLARDILKEETVAEDSQAVALIKNSSIPIKWSTDSTFFLYGENGSGTIVQSQPSPSPTPANSKTTKRTTSPLPSNSGLTTLQDDSNKESLIDYLKKRSQPIPQGTTIKVYNTKSKKTFELPYAMYYEWYPVEQKAEREIQHLMMVEETAISMIESDGSNKSTVYAAAFNPSEVFIWPDGGRLIITANFNPRAGSEPNFYTINLR